MEGRTSGRKNRLLQLEELKNSKRYEEVLKLDFGDMIPFVISNIRKRSTVSTLYFGINAATLLFVIGYIIWGLKESSLFWPILWRQSVMGILAGSILVIPVHELMHGLAYRALGARRIRFGADMTQMIFYVTADRYPLQGGQIIFLAMTPFIVINLASILVVFTWMNSSLLLCSFFLLSHNVMCIGDFAITNYIHLSPARIISWDEVDTMKSYFYRETGSGESAENP